MKQTAVGILKKVISSYATTRISVKQMSNELLELIDNELLEMEEQQQVYSEEEEKFKECYFIASTLNVDENILKFIDKTIKEAKEIENQQQGYSKQEVDELLDKLLKYNRCSFAGDELINKFKNK